MGQAVDRVAGLNGADDALAHSIRQSNAELLQVRAARGRVWQGQL